MSNGEINSRTHSGHQEQSSSSHAAGPSHGREQGDQSSTTFAQPTESGDMSNVRVYVAEIDGLVELYREGSKSKLEVISAITRFLNNDESLTSKERAQSFELYLAEIEAAQVQSGGKGRSTIGPRRDDAAAKMAQVFGSKQYESVGREPSDGGSTQSSDSDDDEPRKKRKLHQSDMPWYGRRGNREVSTNPSCVKSAGLIRKLHRDLKSAKLFIRLAPDAPRGVPMSEWEHIFKGEPVDLDKMLSSLHCVTIDPERKIGVGETEISIGGAEAKRKVETSSEWSVAWRSASRATAFVFGHRERELAEYGDYIERLFAAKRPGSHGQVILFDKGVRNEVGGGQTLLLTDYQYFTSLYAATMQDDGIEYHRGRRGGGGGKSGDVKGEVCLRFNSQNGCRFTESACKYQHTCQSCGQAGHGKPTCGKGN